jgi:hypothetical protein
VPEYLGMEMKMQVNLLDATAVGEARGIVRHK